MTYRADGPAVMLAESSSIFPAQLAAFWRTKGIESVIVTARADAPPALPDGTRVVRSLDYETRATRRLTRRLLNPVLYRLERRVPRYRERFTRRTGLSADTELYVPHFAQYVRDAWPVARAARSLGPRFVFGHEATTYGPPTALCRGIPRIIFPWGGDVFTYCESSPYLFAMTKLSLRAADLVVPSSATGARHISERFGVPAERVQAVSWGVDRERFKRADAARRRAVCERWGIDPGATVFLNARRFHPVWGGPAVLEAFMRLASEYPSAHFILLGGAGSERFTGPARARLGAEGLLPRFTLLEGNAPLEVCAELMSVSDVFASAMGLADMRSFSVLQAAAAGGAPVVSDLPEYREMERQGFAAAFVPPGDAEALAGALRAFARDPAGARRLAERNEAYLAEHEDYPTQMNKLLGLIEGVCARYAAG